MRAAALTAGPKPGLPGTTMTVASGITAATLAAVSGTAPSAVSPSPETSTTVTDSAA